MTFQKRILIQFTALLTVGMSIVTILIYFIFKNTSTLYYEIELTEKENRILSSVDYLISDYPETVTSKNLGKIIEPKILEISDLNKVNINIFSLDGNLIISSDPTGLTESTYDYIKNLSPFLRESQNYKTGKNNFLEKKNYKTHSFSLIYNLKDEPTAILHLPYKYDNSSLSEGFLKFMKYYMYLNAFFLLLGFYVIWQIASSITSRVKKVSESFRNTAVTEKNEPIVYETKDELYPLIVEYNSMVKKLEEQTEQLVIAEREQVWKDVAKQVAHEIKNPLTPMRLLIQSFERKLYQLENVEKSQIKSFSNSLITQIDTISSIAESFSEFANLPKRIDKPVNLVDLTEEIVTLYHRNSISFTSTRNEIIYTIDPNLYNRILTNMIKNSLQAIPEQRQPHVKVLLYKSENDILLEVKDNGTGIAQEDLEKIFLPKFSTKSSGMGIGLSMVKRIVEDYNGKISCQNNSGEEGCTFSVTLPNH